jgi:hypothetical protein
MKFLKTHYGRAINVIPSDTVNIPNPAGLGLTGTATSNGTDQLRDSTNPFTTNLLGAIVVNTTDNTTANVIGFVNSERLVLDADIFTTGEDYAIYNSDNNQGCALYIQAQQPNDLIVLTHGARLLQNQYREPCTLGYLHS